jgi:hypothetical protein
MQALQVLTIAASSSKQVHGAARHALVHTLARRRLARRLQWRP